MTPPDRHPQRPSRGRHPRASASRAPAGSSARPAPTTRSSALLYIATALTFLALAATEFALMRVQLIVPENTLIEPEIFNRLMTRLGGHLRRPRAACPLALGLIGYIVPLQIGARGVALPRLNQLSYWLYLAGGGDAPTPASSTPPRRPGTAALPPLSDLVFSPSNGADAWIVGTGARRRSASSASRSTWSSRVRRLRAPGLAWRRLPLFTWAATVIGYVLLVIGAGDDRGADDARDRPPASTASSSTPARAARRCSTSTSPTSSSPAST